ncbi:uncharacterized protein [Palaemon carinicauda]|uniref:uncharacterized protein n=1 Tax=Palaemon carinicauda TaxID=392227 RepID=UPI0035B5A7AF
MLRGPTWSGSIQQDLIEKLWVAILTCDGDDTTTSQRSREDEVKKKEEESDDESTSSDDSDEGDSDDDLSEFGAMGDNLPQVNRFDLFSVVKLKQIQQSNDESQDVNGNPKDTDIKEEDKTAKHVSNTIVEASSDVTQEASSINIASSKSDAKDSTQATGAKPKTTLSKSQTNAVESRRPRPSTLNFAKPQSARKISQLSTSSFRTAVSAKTRDPKERSGQVSHFVKSGSCREKKNPVGVQKPSPSRIPVSPKGPPKFFQSQDRANLLDVVPRRRFLSDPRPPRCNNSARSTPISWRRKAVTPDAARPCPFLRRGSIKRESKNDDATFKQKPYFRGNVSRAKVGTQRNVCPSSVFVSPSRGDNARGIANVRRSASSAGEKTSIPKILKSPDVSNRRRENVSQCRKPNGVASASCSPRPKIKSQNRETQRPPDVSSLNKGKSTTKKAITISQASATLKGNTEEEKEVQKKCNEIEAADIPNNKSEEEEEENKDEIVDPDLHETTVYGNEVEVTRLENCLKEAIVGVLEGLPEGWILVPEHTAELFSSLTSVVDSFPRPNLARARVLEAIVDAHARRPCDEGEIAALNNAHLLLYVGLKLCSIFSGYKIPDEIPKDGGESLKQPPGGGKVQSTKESKDMKNENDTEVDNQRCHKEVEDIGCSVLSSKGAGNLSLEHKGIVLEILGEILKCEGSFDRLMMCLLLGSRAPGRGSGWYCETEDEEEKVQDLRFVLDHLKFIDGCRVSDVVNTNLWSCGSSPVVLAALAESPRLVLALLQYGAGGGPANLYLYSRCYTNGAYLAIAYLVRKLESQFREEDPDDANPPGGGGEGEEEQAAPEGGRPGGNADVADLPDKQTKKGATDKRDLLKLAGSTPTALCLRYLLRAVPRVPIKFLRDQLGGSSKECWQDVAHLLPHPCCLQPPSLLHLSRAACRQYFRSHDLLPRVVDELNIPETLREYLNLLRD